MRTKSVRYENQLVAVELTPQEVIESALIRAEALASHDSGPQPLSRTEAQRVKDEAKQLSSDEIRGRMRLLKKELTTRQLEVDLDMEKRRAVAEEEARVEYEERLASAQARLTALGLDDIFRLGKGEWGHNTRRVFSDEKNLWVNVPHFHIEFAIPGTRSQESEDVALTILSRLESLRTA